MNELWNDRKRCVHNSFQETAWNDLYGPSTAFERIINFKHQEFNFNLMNEDLQDAPLILRKLRQRPDAKKYDASYLSFTYSHKWM